MADQQNSGGEGRRTSLIGRFNWALIWIYLASLLIIAPAVYYFTRHQVYTQAHEDLTLLVDVVKSIQGYVATDLRPHFMKERIYYSPAISGIVATARIAANLERLQPQYYIKNASDNPLNPRNNSNSLEAALLERFRAQPDVGQVIEEGMIKGRAYLVAAAPKMSKKGCLRCHGEPERAPNDVVNTYGTFSGYHYKVGDVVGVSVVGVPIENVNALALKRSTAVIAAVTVLFALLFVVVNLFVRRLILKPITEITETARAVSAGDVSRQVTSQRQDEVGDLAHSFEMMRRSLVTAMKHMRQNT